MSTLPWLIRLFSLMALSLVMACASQTVSYEVTGKSVDIKVGNFYFKPNLIKVAQPGELMFHVTNEAKEKHNISIKDPDGNIVTSQDISPGQTISFPVGLNKPGTYPFWCNVDLHAHLGMTGRIEVGKSKNAGSESM